MPSSRRNTRRLHKPKPPGPPRVAESLRKAIEWRRQLDAGEVTNQAAIARREGVTRARVTQVLGLLRLPEETRAQILEMPQGSAHRGLSEHALRQAKRAPA
ncbi:MAG: hypothetical protein A49_14500 [Methyloceanibacter sp.]|nr:MAG: hypothetical protein A49_14500 [Methyloceanibacter sp.]